jgi:hypothetical protein
MSHNVFTTPNYGDRRSNEIYDEKTKVDMIDRVETAHTQGLTRMEAPELVRNMSPEERAHAEKVLVRKIDFRLMPMLVIMYILNYLDRNNIASARLAGLETDLKLTSSQYETSVSILFVGYLLMQSKQTATTLYMLVLTISVPSNLFLNKIGKPALYLPAVMCVWGVISTCTAAVQSFGGLIAVRFVLGFVEAAYFRESRISQLESCHDANNSQAGCLFFLSSWYTRKELAFRSAVLYSGSLISGAFSGLIAAGILDGMQGHLGLSAWRWLCEYFAT